MFCRRPQVTSLLIVKPMPSRRALSFMSRYEARCDKLSALGFHSLDALKPGQEVQPRRSEGEHEPDRILPLQQEGFGRSVVQAEQPDGQEQFCQRGAAAVRLRRLKIPERCEHEDE